MECELLRSPMISYQSLLYNTTMLYDYIYIYCILHGQIKGFNSSVSTILIAVVVIELWSGSYRTVE